MECVYPDQAPAASAIQTLSGRCPERKQLDFEPESGEQRNIGIGCSSNGEVLEDSSRVDGSLAYSLQSSVSPHMTVPYCNGQLDALLRDDW